MHYQEFLDRVQQRTGLGSRDAAVQVTAATLETLGERLSKTNYPHGLQ